MITCDQAFDCMTDRDGRESPALESHLEQCERCRQMAETLAPALDALGGPVPPWLQSESVTTSVIARPETVGVAKQTARRLSRARARTSLRRSLLASLGGALVGAFAMAALLPSPKPTATDRNGVCLWKNPSAAKMEDAQTLALSCVVCHLRSAP